MSNRRTPRKAMPAAGLLCGLMLCALLYAAPDHSDASLERHCPAAAKWIAAKKSEQALAQPRHQGPAAKPDLRKELEQRVAADEKARRTAFQSGSAPDKASLQAVMTVDADNLAWLKHLVARDGFPTAADVGQEGVGDAWLLVQHADRDPAFQASVLKQLKPRVKSGDITTHDYAMLVDRVRLAQGKKQLYGSQIEAKDGAYLPKPTEEPAHLDLRREHMDMMPIADYLCVIRASYGPPPKAH